MKCPRCGKDWTRGVTIWQCVCGLQYRRELNEYRLPFDAAKSSLWWENNHTCTYYSSGKEIILPYLPFTVSIEDIQKYLVLI